MTTDERFEALIREHQDMVYTTALRLLARADEAEDIASQVFLKAFQWRDEIQMQKNMGGWLRTVTKNLCFNHLERHRKRWQLFSEIERQDGKPIVETLVEAAKDPAAGIYSKSLEEALLKLPEAQRVPLVLFHFEDMSYEDISRKLGVSLGKIKTDIFRGRETLRKTLELEEERK